MSHILAFWKFENYIEDIEVAKDFAYNSNDPKLYTLPEKGDRVWLITYKGKRYRDNKIYLIAKFVVAKKTDKDFNDKYGRYGIKGDPKTSKYYKINREASVYERILDLDFEPYNPIPHYFFEEWRILPYIRY